MTLTVMTWLWRQTPDKSGYFEGAGGADKVNVWAAMVRRNCTLDIELACVTDEPDGIDPSIRIIPLPQHFSGVSIKQWREDRGLPQCYRRLAMFSPRAADIFGAERFVSMDLDCVVVGSMDRLWDNDCSFVMFGGTSKDRPYNGSMIQMDAGARPQVWEQFSADPLGLATRARARYIGSDQAVISIVLGPGEERWTAADGAEAWGGTFIKRNGGHRDRLSCQATTRVVFFPGIDKPWRLLDTVGFINEHWHDGAPRGTARSIGPGGHKPLTKRVPFYAYDDPKKWGRLFKAAADKITGQPTRLFIREHRVLSNARAFVRLDQQAKQRDISRGMVAALHRRGVITLPTYQEMLWYDDKVAQLPALERWLPKTCVATSKDDALGLIDSIMSGDVPDLEFPLISKAKEGSSSATVRMLRDESDALAEIDAVFGAGIIQRYDRVQKGYVYWQRFVPENPCDYRVCIVGKQFYGLVRQNRPGSFTASGSGNFKPLTLADDRERAAARLCVEIASAIGTQWMAFDVVFDPDSLAPLVLEMSSAWTMDAYRNCPMFDFDLKPLNSTGADSFRVAVEVLRGLPALSSQERNEAQPAVAAG